jgi:hypothetical protein
MIVAGVIVAMCSCGPTYRAGLMWTHSTTDPSVISVTPASFAVGANVTEAVFYECDLQREIPEQIARHARVPIVLTEQGGPRTLRLIITHVLAPGGGMWSGPKSLTLHGELWAGGSVIGSFDARRTTIRGQRTCEMLGIVANALAQDIRPWLDSPWHDAQLGEL